MSRISRITSIPIVIIALALVAGFQVPSAGAQTNTLTLDVSENWVFVSFSAPDAVVSVTDPASSDAWDIAFQGTNVMLNGGSAGPADVGGICICANQWVSDDEIRQMTADTEAEDFLAVTAASIPADAEWTASIFGTSPWFRYNIRDDHMIWPNFNVYVVRRDDAMYRVQLTGYYNEYGEPRHLTLQYEQIAG